MIQLTVSIKQQTLSIHENQKLLTTYPISSAANGTGTEEGSFKTPTGEFKIDEKHGFNAPVNTIFKSRKPQGVWDTDSQNHNDLVLTRILWLSGLNQQNSNTKKRYIYIHGTNHEDLIGSPQSCGCIRMKNSDIIELYNTTPLGSLVTING